MSILGTSLRLVLYAISTATAIICKTRLLLIQGSSLVSGYQSKFTQTDAREK